MKPKRVLALAILLFCALAGTVACSGNSSTAPISSSGTAFAPSSTSAPTSASPSVPPRPSGTPNVTPSSKPDDAEAILASLEVALDVRATIADGGFEGIDDKMEVAPYSGKSFDLDATPGNMIATADRFFLAAGFKKAAVPPTTPALVIMAYDSGAMKCSISVEPGSRASASFGCGTYDQKADLFKQQFKNVGNPSNNPMVEFHVKLLDAYPDYASGSSDARGCQCGVGWYAVKVNGVWTKIWSGQSFISCDLVRQYSIPQAIYGKCEN